MGPQFTLLRFALGVAAHRGVPMDVLDVEADESGSLYPSQLVLSRPDQHVAWRGDQLPDDSLGLIDRERGSPSKAKI